MSGLQATPGPWRVGKAGPNQCPTVGTHQGLMVCMVTHGDCHPTQANANLIAAAPELYEVLQAIQFLADNDDGISPRVLTELSTKAQAALAKARGEPS